MDHKQYIHGIDFTKVESITEFFDKRRGAVIGKMKALAQHMKSAISVSKHKHEFYEFKQELIEERFNCMTLYEIYSKDMRLMKRNLITAYKEGQTTTLSHDTKRVMKNADERAIYQENDLRMYLFRLNVINNHIEFIVEQTKTITNQIYGFELVYNLDQKYKEFS